MFDVRQSTNFIEWLRGLRDPTAQRRISTRIFRLKAGLFGDVRFFDGIGELRIDYGPGYRVYFVQRGKLIVILLIGGDKSTQSKDIATATAMLKNLEIPNEDQN